MIIATYKENIITKVINIRTEQEFLQKYLLQEDEFYKIFEATNAYKGLDIRSLNENGELLPLSEQIELGLIELADDEILENERIRKLTEEELRELFPEKFPEEKIEETREKTVHQAVQEKNNEIRTLKDQYLDAEIDNNEEWKLDLKTQIQEAKKELSVLEIKLSEHEEQSH